MLVPSSLLVLLAIIMVGTIRAANIAGMAARERLVQQLLPTEIATEVLRRFAIAGVRKVRPVGWGGSSRAGPSQHLPLSGRGTLPGGAPMPLGRVKTVHLQRLVEWQRVETCSLQTPHKSGPALRSSPAPP